jgi:ABC-type nitrate/sulfonate/bicarbonate transport system substrate-binding protein
MTNWLKAMTITACCLLSMAPAAAQNPPVLNMGFSGAGVGADLLKVIERAGLWRKHGLDVRVIYLSSGNLMAQTLSSGDIGIAGFDVTAMLNLAVAGGTDLRVVAVMINRLEPFFVVRNSIKTPADLKGKKITISRFGSGSDIITRVALRYWKLDPDKDVALYQSGNTPTRIAALVAGHMDAALVSSTQLQKIVATGCCRALADLSELPIAYANYGVVVSESLLRTQRDNVRRFLQAFTEGIQVFKTKPDAAMAVLREHESDLQATQSLYARLSKAMMEYPVPDMKGVQTAIDSLLTPKARGARAEDFVDPSLMEEIKKSGFVDRLYGRAG